MNCSERYVRKIIKEGRDRGFFKTTRTGQGLEFHLIDDRGDDASAFSVVPDNISSFLPAVPKVPRESSGPALCQGDDKVPREASGPGLGQGDDQVPREPSGPALGQGNDQVHDRNDSSALTGTIVPDSYKDQKKFSKEKQQPDRSGPADPYPAGQPRKNVVVDLEALASIRDAIHPDIRREIRSASLVRLLGVPLERIKTESDKTVELMSKGRIYNPPGFFLSLVKNDKIGEEKGASQMNAEKPIIAPGDKIIYKNKVFKVESSGFFPNGFNGGCVPIGRLIELMQSGAIIKIDDKGDADERL